LIGEPGVPGGTQWLDLAAGGAASATALARPSNSKKARNATLLENRRFGVATMERSTVSNGRLA
jgi:hypothetical protein